jgi:prevent-host-death family protein
MPQSITATEANQAFSSMLRRVQQGEQFVVMSRGRAVARVIPYVEEPQATGLAALLDELEAKPIRSGPAWTREDLYS